MESTIRYGGLPIWGFPEGNTKILHHLFLWAAYSGILMMLRLKSIWSMIGILIAMKIRMISYCYWLSRTQKFVRIRHQHFICENLMFSSLKAMILILQIIWRPYQVKTRINTCRQWMMKSKDLWEGTHGRFFREVSCWSQCASINIVFQVQEDSDWKISKFKAWYFLGRDIKKILSPKPLKSYSPVLQWAAVMLMLILKCILGL